MSLLRRVGLLIAISAAVAAGLALAGCCTGDAVARVNGVAITRTQVQTQLDQIKASSPATFEGAAGKKREKEFFARIVDSMIQVEVLSQAADELGVKVTDEAVDAYVKNTESQYGGPAKFAEVLKQANTDRKAFWDTARSRLLVEAVAKALAKKRTYSDAEVRAYYEKNKTLFEGKPEYRASQILVALDKEDLASDLQAKVENGGDLGALARQYSIDVASKVRGGQLEWAGAAAFEPEVAEALGIMDPGDVMLVKSRQGWHVLRLDAKRMTEGKTLAQVHDQIVKILQETSDSTAFTTFVGEARAKARIEILDPEVKAILEPAKPGGGK